MDSFRPCHYSLTHENLQLLNDYQISYPSYHIFPLTDISLGQGQISHLPSHELNSNNVHCRNLVDIDSLTNINSQPLDNNQIPYSQEPVLSSQSPNHSCSDTYQTNSQSQSPHHRQQPQKDQQTTPIRRRQRRKPQKHPYEKRKHASIACNPCRKARLRCEKKDDSLFCNRCIETNEKCIFDKNPKKRGRRCGTRNKSKADDNIVYDIKQCCWPGSNELIADSRNLYILDPLNNEDNCYQQILFSGCTSTYNHQTNARQRLNPDIYYDTPTFTCEDDFVISTPQSLWAKYIGELNK
nr:1163_t:CDS:2 [Entrophospora candida]